jgi:hypothetical protein
VSARPGKASLWLEVYFYLAPSHKRGTSRRPKRPDLIEDHAVMRAEAEALVENIKQSMGLLRRHL